MINTLPRSVRITDIACEMLVPFDSLDGASLHGSLAIEKATFGPAPEPRVGLTFQLLLERDSDRKIVTRIWAGFEAIYPDYVSDLRSQQQEFVATKALPDLWPYWWMHLQSTMTQMGLIPLTERPANMEQLAAQVRQLFKQHVEDGAHEA